MPRLTKHRAERDIPEAIKRGARSGFLRCSEIRGFCVRVTDKGARAYCVEVTESGKSKLHTLGPVGVLAFEGPADEPGARDLAIAALAASRRGGDAKLAIGKKKAPQGMTLNEVWAEYEKAGYPVLRGTGRKRPSTIKGDKDRWSKYVDKEIGKKLVSEINTAVVQRWLDKIPSDGQRSHALVLAKSILAYAGSRGLAEPHRIDIKAKKSKEMQNFYSADDLVALDEAAADLAVEHPHRIAVFAALRLLLHTGARTGEILSARWTDIDFRRRVLILERDKTTDTGREVLLSDAAIAVLKSLPRLNSSNWVFPSDSARGHLTTLQKPWADVVERASVIRYRRHDLRHSFASTAIANGVSLYVAGQLLGHRQATTTQRYAHLEQDAARAALDKVAGAIRKPDSNQKAKRRAA